MNNRPLRIGISTSSKTSGGGRVFATNIVNTLNKNRSVDSIVVYLHGRELGTELPADVEVVHLPTSSNPIVDRITRGFHLERALRRVPCDIILFPGTELPRVSAARKIYWPLTVAPLEPETVRLLGTSRVKLLRWNLLRQRIRMATWNADAVVYSSNYARDLYCRRFSALRKLPSTVIWPATSLPGRVSADEPGKPEQSKILFVSHLYPYKMVAEMISAYGIAVKLGLADTQLLIAGGAPDPEYSRRVDEAIEFSGAKASIQRLGHVDQSQLDNLYANSSVFVFPSASENAGSYALIDAFRYGLPVLSSNKSSMPEVCGSSALLFNPSEPSTLAHQLLTFFGDAELRQVYSAKSAERYNDFPSWTEIGERLVEFIRSDVPE